MDFVTFALIIDDIVLPDGQTYEGQLGGGGPQAAFGLKLWAERVGLVSGVGLDLPAEARRWLTRSGIDSRGLRLAIDQPTPRAWQRLAADGSRRQEWRVGPAVVAHQLSHRWRDLPPDYHQARAFHLGVHPEQLDLDFITSLGERGALVSLETFRSPTRALTEAELRALVTAGQIFSANEAEAVALVGPGAPASLVRRLAAAGAEVVLLRRGAAGALVYRADRDKSWAIPAYPSQVVDPTGAGNAFCGAFLAGWLQHGNLRLAGLYGAVAASFLVEQVGLPAPALSLRAEARVRLAWLAGQVGV